MIELKIFDWFIIVFYFFFIILIGVYLRRWSYGNEEFFLAGRRNSALVSAFAFLSANLGSLEILGWTGASYKYGMLTAHFYWIGAVPAMLFLGIFMMKFYYKKRIFSVPGYVGERFDQKTQILSAISFAIMTILMSGVNIYLMALIFKMILGWNWHVSIWVSGITVSLYVALGGLMSAIFTEVVQFFLIWLGLVPISALIIIEFGGLSFIERIPHEMASLWATTLDPSKNPMGVDFLGIILGLGFVLSFGYWTADFLVIQRAFAAENLQAARLAPIIASFFKALLPFVVTFGGIAAFLLVADNKISLLVDENGNVITDSALPALIVRYFPPGLVGLGITALLAGFMAGQAGNITAFNTAFTQDIYKPLFRPKASEEELVIVGRISTVIGMLISIASAYWAMRFPTIMDYIQAIFSWVNAPLFAIILLGMFSKRISSAGAFWGLLTGMVFSFLLFMGVREKVIPPEYVTFYNDPSEMALNLWRAFWSFLVSFAVTCVISFFTKPEPIEKIKGLVKGAEEKIEEKPTTRSKFYTTPEFWALVSLTFLIALNAIFF